MDLADSILNIISECGGEVMNEVWKPGLKGVSQKFFRGYSRNNTVRNLILRIAPLLEPGLGDDGMPRRRFDLGLNCDRRELFYVTFVVTMIRVRIGEGLLGNVSKVALGRKAGRKGGRV